MGNTLICVTIGGALGLALVLLYRFFKYNEYVKRKAAQRQKDEAVRAAIAEDRAKGLPVFPRHVAPQSKPPVQGSQP